MDTGPERSGSASSRVLWIGYFVLEGFDFGVGMLLPFLGSDDRDRRVLINTIGPVWDGNEVWLLVAGGATFAAFPGWYATLFSGFYLALFLILVALIVRGVAFEYRGKHDRTALAAPVGPGDLRRVSAVPALLWGVAFANIVHGVPIDATARVHRHAPRPAQPVRAARRAHHARALHAPRRVFLALKTDGRAASSGARAGSRGSRLADRRARLRRSCSGPT